MSATTAADHDVVIIGSGFSGLGMAIRLKQEGNEDFVVLEKDPGLGGTWWANTYPGCACDVQSFVYSFSFEQNPDWSRMFASQEEIRAYLERCAEKYDIQRHVRTSTHVTALEWDEAAGLWRIEIGGSEEALTARVVVTGFGGLSSVSYPAIEGIEKFSGPAFHSADWDHDVDLAGKRVAVIGTGASAVQFVPRIRESAAHVDLFQRTPPWILPKADRAITKLERMVYRRFPVVQRAYRNYIYLKLESRAPVFTRYPKLLRLSEKLATRQIRRQISDPELQSKVTPDYAIGCKRILLSDDYYPALDSPNVDVRVEGIERITESGVVSADGVEHQADVIVFGTGFEPTEVFKAVDIRGRGGVALSETWTEAAEAYKGTTVAGFPNLFMLVGPNVGLGHNSMVFMIESQIEYVADALRLMRERRVASVDVRPEVQAGYNRELQSRLAGTIWQTGGCTSWYQDENGRNTALWPGSTVAFRQRTRQFDHDRYELVMEPTSELVAAG